MDQSSQAVVLDSFSHLLVELCHQLSHQWWLKSQLSESADTEMNCVPLPSCYNKLDLPCQLSKTLHQTLLTYYQLTYCHLTIPLFSIFFIIKSVEKCLFYFYFYGFCTPRINCLPQVSCIGQYIPTNSWISDNASLNLSKICPTKLSKKDEMRFFSSKWL